MQAVRQAWKCERRNDARVAPEIGCPGMKSLRLGAFHLLQSRRSESNIGLKRPDLIFEHVEQHAGDFLPYAVVAKLLVGYLRIQLPAPDVVFVTLQIAMPPRNEVKVFVKILEDARDLTSIRHDVGLYPTLRARPEDEPDVLESNVLCNACEHSHVTLPFVLL
jgi:hypothetical protein